MIDEHVLRRLLQSEGHKLNLGTVEDPVLLSHLLRMDTPRAQTRRGGWHGFDPDVLRALERTLSPYVRSGLRLPMTAHVQHDLPGDCFFDDATAIEAVQQMGLSGGARDGRLWVSRARVEAFAREHPGLVQFIRR